METRILLRAVKTFLALLCIVAMVLLTCCRSARAETVVANMRNYCSLPPVPLPGFGVKPNLLLMIDNSASMYDPAYTDQKHYCLDDSTDSFATADQPHLGYFEPATFYRYRFVTDVNGNESGYFEAIADNGIPGSSQCNRIDGLDLTGWPEKEIKAYALIKKNVCVNISSGKVDNFVASGNFLNWLSMSKLDIEKMALTGGKFNTQTGLLQGETRGCQGKRFIKMLGAAELTFAVRGPVPAEEDYVYQASQGGMTRIEIYPKRYRKDACLAAVTAWQEGTLEQLKVQTDLCMGNEYDENWVPTKGTIYNQIMADCYSYHASSPRDDSILLDFKLLDDCAMRVQYVYNFELSAMPINQGEDICGSSIYHKPWSPGKTRGYLGMCFDTLRSQYTDLVCDKAQIKDYCAELMTPTLTDPSATAFKPGTNANLPGFILDAGIYDLGQVAGTMRARITLGSQPNGLIQEFGEIMNFGAMVFNNGAGTECTANSAIPCVKHCQNNPQMECYEDPDCGAGACLEDTFTDGGRIISYINHSPLGDHDTGLIAAIDQVRAQSWTPLAESFYNAMGYFANRSDLRLQNNDFDTSWPPSKSSCQKNNVLIVTDGMSTADRAQAVRKLVGDGVTAWANGEHKMPASKTTLDPAATDPAYHGSYNLDDLAWIARHKNLNDPEFRAPIANPRDYISTHVIYGGTPCGTYSDPPDNKNCVTQDEGVPEKMMQLAASNGGGNFFSAQKPQELVTALRRMLRLIGTATNSTTDSSILATGEGNGAFYLQEQFYRRKSFDGGDTMASWIGEMQGLWYFIDPLINSSGDANAIREDTGGFKELDLKRNRVVKYVFDPGLGETLANLYLDGDGDGAIDAPQPTGYPVQLSPDAVQSLWRAGLQLWEREPQTRTIYTQTDGKTLIGFTENATVPTFLDLSKSPNQKLLQAGSQSEAESIVSFVQGVDSAGTRNRTVAVGGSSKVWKLGDIISSTPVLQSPASLGSYHLGVPRGYNDGSYGKFVNYTGVKLPGRGVYQKRGTAYVGANDGMLHAFRLGLLQLKPKGGEARWPLSKKAVLSKEEGIGEEMWAYIPQNAVPYLRYLKELLYPHLYYVDGSSTIADVSIGDPEQCGQNGYWNCQKDIGWGSNWRTVLIGGMGLGGASREPDDGCVEGAAGTCIKSPQQNAGLSSYFALDVTEQTSDGSAKAPRLLWEFSPPGLGYATSGAAIIKVNVQSGNPPKDDKTKNGRWFAVFASGPTGPLDQDSCQFLGNSGQNLKLFVVDINASPPLAEGVGYWVIDTGIGNAFGGSMYRAGIDADKWNPKAEGHYEDDALYVGYSRRNDDGTWSGGVLRLLTGENLDPGQWKVSKVIDGIGPVTGSVSKLQDRMNHNLWLYFGTGRFFHNQDDLTVTRALFGVKEPCYIAAAARENGYILDGKCSAEPVLLSKLTDMTDNKEETLPAGSKGWWIGLDKSSGAVGSERATANPVSLTSGMVFFTTFQPPLDACFQGTSYLWGVQYDTGGDIAGPWQGRALVPLSNGSSSEFSLTGLTEREKRRSPGMPGKPGGVKLITNTGLRPLKKIIHIQER